jgi:retron-type reverse transcriptase
VVDRLIQQALLQQLMPIFEPLFSDCSYGFRPGKSAHQVLETARDHVAEDRRWCVELDLEKFFDWVNYDVLMAYVARQIEDKRVLMQSCVISKRERCQEDSSVDDSKGRRKAARSRRYCRTSCSASSAANWNGGVIASCAMTTTPNICA